MTTIAFDGVTMAADGRSTSGYVIATDEFVKVHRTNGKLWALCGEPRFIDSIARFLTDGTPIAQSKDDECLYEYIVWDGCKLMSYMNDRSVGDEWHYPMGFGSGGNAATAAMRAGLNAIDAVKVAITMDVYSGGKITALTLGD